MAANACVLTAFIAETTNVFTVVLSDAAAAAAGITNDATAQAYLDLEYAQDLPDKVFLVSYVKVDPA